jgi:hypothetical protein
VIATEHRSAEQYVLSTLRRLVNWGCAEKVKPGVYRYLEHDHLEPLHYYLVNAASGDLTWRDFEALLAAEVAEPGLARRLCAEHYRVAHRGKEYSK